MPGSLPAGSLPVGAPERRFQSHRPGEEGDKNLTLFQRSINSLAGRLRSSFVAPEHYTIWMLFLRERRKTARFPKVLVGAIQACKTWHNENHSREPGPKVTLKRRPETQAPTSFGRNINAKQKTTQEGNQLQTGGAWAPKAPAAVLHQW